MLKKIVAIGPESTGKTTLCESLAQYYQTRWCPEFAREYLSEHGADYSYEDLLAIAKGQVALEDSYIQSFSPQAASTPAKPEILFVDTDMYVMKVWSEYVFGNCHRYILDQIIARPYDLYFLCDIDLPWVEDELREYPDRKTRERLFRIYEDLLINQSVPWAVIQGDPDQRLQMAILSVDKLLQE